jgi:hypothetical protein
MWKRLTLSVALVVALITGPTHTRPVHAAQDNGLRGVWQIVDDSGRPGPGIYIFAGRYYSMMVANADRPDITDTSQATADELRALWNPMAANAGVYEVAGDLVTIRPVVAKIPVVMKPGAYEVYAFRVEGSTLSLTQRRNVRGPVEGRAATKLIRVE